MWRLQKCCFAVLTFHQRGSGKTKAELPLLEEFLLQIKYIIISWSLHKDTLAHFLKENDLPKSFTRSCATAYPVQGCRCSSSQGWHIETNIHSHPHLHLWVASQFMWKSYQNNHGACKSYSPPLVIMGICLMSELIAFGIYLCGFNYDFNTATPQFGIYFTHVVTRWRVKSRSWKFMNNVTYKNFYKLWMM